MVRAVRSGPVIGLTGHAALLAAVAWTVGLGVAGWLAGAACALVGCAALNRAMDKGGFGALGPADRVTLSRAALVAGVAALTADSLAGGDGRRGQVAVLVGLAVVALVLDGVDGQVARRSGTSSALGARFDMEVDAFLILVLSIFDAPRFGGWVLAMGLMRYAFVAAYRLLPWMRRPLPTRYWGKVVASAQGIALVAAASGVLPRTVALAGLLGAFALLVQSFGQSVLWLWQRRHAASEVPVPLHT
jgi:phosphatidylglycerophosphate synthase